MTTDTARAVIMAALLFLLFLASAGVLALAIIDLTN